MAFLPWAGRPGSVSMSRCTSSCRYGASSTRPGLEAAR